MNRTSASTCHAGSSISARWTAVSARLVAVCALTLVGLTASCSDDAAGPDASTGDGARDQGAVRDQPQAAEQTVRTDQRTPGDQILSVDLPPGSGSNSGAICSASQPCVLPEELCTYFGTSTGMCLSPCQKKGLACRVAQEFAQLSTCSITGLDGKWYCGWLCLSDGTPFQCPNATDYACVPSGKDGFSFCHPK